MAEVGVPNFNLEIWNAVAAPKSTPPAIIAKLATLVSDISRSPEIRQQLFAQGWQVVGSSPEGLAKRIQADTLVFGGVIKKLGVSNQ
jgi:tripartite-type tricarboxylate transporter receptor subunit TctC